MSLFNRWKKRKSVERPSAFDDEKVPLNLEVQIAQSLGVTRNNMEDAVFSLNVKCLNPNKHYTMGLFMVADGMGGHMHGEMASSLAIQATSGSLLNSIFNPAQGCSADLSDEEVREALTNAVQSAQDAVLAQVEGGGTTLTLALVLDKTLHFAHVGDSRLYLTSATKPLQALTLDHSLVQHLVELGQISKDDALEHPQRNVLFRALGQPEGFKTDIGHVQLAEPCTLLLCSDGLWGLVDQETLSKRINEGGDYEEMVNELVEMANSAGGTDNISAILVRIS